MTRFSFIVPVFNRPDEVDELLQSLTRQTVRGFEVIVVEDGSQVPCRDVCEKYASQLDIHYFDKPNSGPGQSRNYGVERAQGEYVIILDSDVVLPDGYLAAVEQELQREPADAFGGPDSAHPSFTPTQKAISYSMTSFFTTGGIRGGHARSTWAYVARSMSSSAASRQCALARTSISAYAYSRAATAADCFLRHGCGISAAPTSASSSVRSTTAALPA